MSDETRVVPVKATDNIVLAIRTTGNCSDDLAVQIWDDAVDAASAEQEQKEASVVVADISSAAVDAAVAAIVAHQRESNGDAARWPEDYDPDEITYQRDGMQLAIAAYLAAAPAAPAPEPVAYQWRYRPIGVDSWSPWFDGAPDEGLPGDFEERNLYAAPVAASPEVKPVLSAVIDDAGWFDLSVETQRLVEKALAVTTEDQSRVRACLVDGGWRPIHSAPEDTHVIIATSGGFVGEALMLMDEDTGQQKWTWALGPVHPNHVPLGWMPLPSPPATGVE